jgi:hypothetical protein
MAREGEDPRRHLAVHPRPSRVHDRVRVSAPFGLRTEKAPDDPAVQSLFYGPVLLVARSAEPDFRAFSFYQDFTLRGDLADAVRPAGKPMHFTTHGLVLAPFHIGDDSQYHAYFRRSEPCPCRKSHPSWWELVYGGLERGRSDGCSGRLGITWA